MAPKLTSFWNVTEVLAVRVNLVGVLVSGGLPWHIMSGVVTGGDMTRSCDEVVLCDIDDAATVVLLAAVAAVLADVLVLAVTAAVLAAVTVLNDVVELPAAASTAVALTSLASVAVAACFAVEPGCGSAAELVQAAE